MNERTEAQAACRSQATAQMTCAGFRSTQNAERPGILSQMNVINHIDSLITLHHKTLYISKSKHKCVLLRSSQFVPFSPILQANLPKSPPAEGFGRARLRLKAQEANLSRSPGAFHLTQMSSALHIPYGQLSVCLFGQLWIVEVGGTRTKGSHGFLQRSHGFLQRLQPRLRGCCHERMPSKLLATHHRCLTR